MAKKKLRPLAEACSKHIGNPPMYKISLLDGNWEPITGEGIIWCKMDVFAQMLARWHTFRCEGFPDAELIEGVRCCQVKLLQIEYVEGHS